MNTLTPEFEAELDAAFTLLPSTVARWQARDAAVKVHDWPAYWQAFIDESRDRQDRLTADKAPEIVISNEKDLREGYEIKRTKALVRLWPASKDQIPAGYEPDPVCRCVVCCFARRSE